MKSLGIVAFIMGWAVIFVGSGLPAQPVLQPGAASQPQSLPAGVQADWWSQVQAEIQKEEYEITWQDEPDLPDLRGAYQAPNRAQGFRTWFTEEGIRVVPQDPEKAQWEWGLSLAAGPEAGSRKSEAGEKQKAWIHVSDNRIEFDRGWITEWYENCPEGLEQGFTISSPLPAKRETRNEKRETGEGDISHFASHVSLSIDLRLTGTLHPKFSDDGQAVDFYDNGNVSVIHYAHLKVTDATGRVLPSHFEGIASSPSAERGALNGSSGGVRIAVHAAGAVYPITVDPLATSAAWAATGEAANDNFGYSVATAGDVNGDGYADVVVGANGFNGSAGKAFVYLGGPTGLSGTAAWTATGEGPGNYFGVSVATAGDVNGDGYSDVVVGAEGYNNNWTGKSYLYLGGAAGLSETSAWTVVGEHTGDRFGVRVATAGDVNGDGYSDVAVGAACYSSLYGEGGKAYLYLGGPSGLSATPSWTALGEGAVNRFGHSLGTAGDVNGDGYSDVVVGAFSYNNLLYRGKAYLYLGGPSGLASAPAWTETGEADYDYYGVCVATAGDVNGDGYADVVVAARNFNGAMGKVYLYPGGPSGLSATAAWTATGEAATNYFGYSAATAGDVNGDGYSDVVVGAHLYSGSAGKAYLFLGGPSGLSINASWTAAGEAGNNYFSAVATAGDVNGDGFSDVIVGAYGNNANTGKAYVYLGGPSGLSSSSGWTAAGEAAGNLFATSAATAGDVNGDGYSDVIVGASGFSGNAGKAYLYLGGPSGLSAAPAWTAAAETAGDTFGTSVASAGDVNGDGYSDVIIGAQNYGGGYTGKAYLYLGGPSGLSATPGWSAVGEAVNNYFGYAVAGAGDVNGDGFSDVIVGAFGASAGTGKVYLYLGGPAGPAASAGWTAIGEAVNTNFGYSVATAGDVNGDGYSEVVLGATAHNGNTGKAYLYMGGPSGLAATAAWTATGEAAGNYFGTSVATAGDVNGDGYSDVIVGAHYNNGTRGKAYLYPGGPSGLSGTASWTAVGEAASNYFGTCVAGAGDVNGDGYSDVVVAAPQYTSTPGKVVLFLGGPAGLAATASWTASGEAASNYFGRALSAAGDVNGDGYSDVVVGAYGFSGNTGKAYLYFGNGGSGVPMRPQQLRADLTAPIAPLGLAFSQQYRIGLRLRTPYGRANVKLQWQAVLLGTSFTPAISPIQSDTVWTSSGITGLQQKKLLALPDPPGPYKWRARVRFQPAGSPFQQYGPWFTPAANGLQETDLRSTTSAPPPACVVPDEPCWLYSVVKNGTDYTLNWQDPNQPGARTGWNIRRSNNAALPKGTWPLVGTNIVDMDAATPNNQWTDHSGADPTPSPIWYYQVTTYNGSCPAEGPF